MSIGANSDSKNAPDSLPDDAESAKVAELQKTFPGGDVFPAIAVITRDGSTIKPQDRSFVDTLRGRWAEIIGASVAKPVPSEDGQALLVSIPVPADVSGLNLTDTVDELRAASDAGRPDGLRVELTGGSAFAADISSAFEGANVRLLAVTASVVAILLLLTYR